MDFLQLLLLWLSWLKAWLWSLPQGEGQLAIWLVAAIELFLYISCVLRYYAAQAAHGERGSNQAKWLRGGGCLALCPGAIALVLCLVKKER